MTPKRIDVERVAEAIRTKKDYGGVACDIAAKRKDSHCYTDKQYAGHLIDAAIRLLLREQDKVIRAAMRWRNSLGFSSDHVELINVTHAYDESRRSRAARVRKEENR